MVTLTLFLASKGLWNAFSIWLAAYNFQKWIRLYFSSMKMVEGRHSPKGWCQTIWGKTLKYPVSMFKMNIAIHTLRFCLDFIQLSHGMKNVPTLNFEWKVNSVDISNRNHFFTETYLWYTAKFFFLTSASVVTSWNCSPWWMIDWIDSSTVLQTFRDILCLSICNLKC